MTNQWREFLTARNAYLEDDGGIRFPKVAGPRDSRLFDLSHLGLIAVRGADADAFLQGQLTNDIREVSATHTQFSGYCSQKGRLLASFRVMRIADALYLQTPAERLPDALKRLRIFILRSKVTLEDASDDLIRIGIASARLADLLAGQGLILPERDNACVSNETLSVIRLPGAIPRCEILGPFPAIGQLWDGLANQAPPANRLDWTRLDIQAGIPNVYNRTAEVFIPQMINLQLIDGVSFHKGCYTGQEVVARMQHLGKLKRRMYLAEVDAPAPPQPGEELHASSSTSQQAAGWVVDAAPLDAGRHALLAVVEVSAAEGGEVRLGDQGPVLSLQAPPYGFPES
ncbi:YgfZ/GcvT domain-containing protein [Thiocystis violascens]|uniref:Folate-binding protein YgfZ n=1 Tax=Thiocystis violascens (strain ATCC 17096 / DSM 198 / 6111) TaxID=765911 RepID=I3Y746_THIV6|nr:folate-binding protein YgfZ [Thiocystis violascens]AFL72814.1 folate-binding protein YgfZ [Thiocystis violascens DSM 198]